MSAEEFLSRVREMRYGTAITDADLLGALSDFMKGVAYWWQRQNRHNFVSWEDFEKAFRKTYGDRNFQVRVNRELLTRTQGRLEPIGDFIVHFRNILGYVDPPRSLEDELTLTHSNLRPEYRDRIKRVDISSFEELEELGSIYEAKLQADKEYRPPPDKAEALLRESAYQENIYKKKTSGEASGSQAPASTRRLAAIEEKEGAKPKTTGTRPKKTSTKETPKKSPPKNEKTPPTCYRCHVTGHIQWNCPDKEKSIFCMGCGKKNVTVYKCEDCKARREKAGNETSTQ